MSEEKQSFIGYCECVDCTAVHLKGVNIGNRAENPQIANLEAENSDYFDTVAELRKELSTLAIESVNREKVLAKLEAEVERLRVELEKLESWQGIMELVNKIYPAHIFLDSDGDINEINWAEFSNVGVVVVNLIRRIDKLRAENPQTTELEENDYAKTRAAAVEKLLDGLGLPNAKSLAGLTEIELMAAAEKIAELEKENEKLRLAGVCDGCVG